MCGIVKRACTYVLLMVMGIVHTYAISVPDQEWSAAPAMRSQQILTTGVTYNGTIYTPFDNTTPSELQGVGASYRPDRRLYTESQDEGRDPGEATGGSELSPVGEPWIMAFFALIFAGVIAWRQHHIRIETETQE